MEVSYENGSFCIIGTGFMGGNHAACCTQAISPVRVLPRYAISLPHVFDWARQTFGDEVAIYQDYHELLSSGKVDAVLIATPHYLHPVIAIDALEAGLHTLVESLPAYTRKKSVK